MKEYKRKRGFVVYAQNSPEVDYVHLSYVLALSVCATQKTTPYITLLTNMPDAVPEEKRWPFDNILPLYMNDEIVEGQNPFTNEWKIFHSTPYEETIKLEADMLLTEDLEWVWELLKENDIYIPNHVYTFKNELADTSYYRQTFIQNEIYNAFSAFTYFKHTTESWKFFNLVQELTFNWRDYSWQQLWKVPQPIATTDVIWGLTTTLLDKEYAYSIPNGPSFVHMKSLAQNWPGQGITDTDWRDYAHFTFTDNCKIFVNNYRQTKPFHYVAKDFVTDEMIYIYKRYLNAF